VIGVCGRGRGAPDSPRLGCPIGSVSYRHNHPGGPRPPPPSTPGQRQSPHHGGKSIPPRKKNKTKQIRGKAWLSPRGRALPGGPDHPAAAAGAAGEARPGGGSEPPPRQPCPPAGRSRRRGIALLSCGPHLPPPRFPEGLRQPPRPPSIHPSLSPSVFPSVRPSRRLRAGPRRGRSEPGSPGPPPAPAARGPWDAAPGAAPSSSSALCSW